MDQAGVFVLGMHRSGTSAVARLVNLLGVPMCVEADLVRAAPSNPRGHWESVSLVRFNDALLHKHGRAWWCPPRLGLVCSGDPSAARELFASVYPTKQWVWKDPRTCLTLSFWLEALNTRPVGILVLRNPLEIAHSLERRDEFYLELSLALWERYMHHGLTALAGLPVAAFQFEELVADPMGPRPGSGYFCPPAGSKFSNLIAQRSVTSSIRFFATRYSPQPRRAQVHCCQLINASWQRSSIRFRPSHPRSLPRNFRSSQRSPIDYSPDYRAITASPRRSPRADGRRRRPASS